MKVITTKSVGVASPVLDGEGKTLTVDGKPAGNLESSKLELQLGPGHHTFCVQ